jgi:PAS domain S-box-containing protein
MLEIGASIGPLTVAALRAFMNRSETAMLLTDGDLRYRDANPAACRLFGLSHKELLERTIGDLTPSHDQVGLSARVDAFRQDGSLRGVVTVVGAGGRLVQVEFSAIAEVVPGLALSLLEPLGSGEDLTKGSSDWNDRAAEEPLTPREREVLTALALGRSGAEIATELFISPETVRNHVRNARTKLGARTRAQAIARALHRGEIYI